jgi:hypothetical protein
MPAYPRHEILTNDQIGVYHCIARSVRRPFLCRLDRPDRSSVEVLRTQCAARYQIPLAGRPMDSTCCISTCMRRVDVLRFSRQIRHAFASVPTTVVGRPSSPRSQI